MTLFVGSINPVKVNAVKAAAQDHWPDVMVKGYAVESGISDQPLSDDETRQGAQTRAQRALQAGLLEHSAGQAIHGAPLGVGLEGGVFEDHHGEMWSTVWVAVIDQEGKMFHANGARIKVPQIIADRVRRGEELGPIVHAITGRDDVRTGEGMFGIITKNFVNRTEEYSALAKMALGLWYGKDWLNSV